MLIIHHNDNDGRLAAFLVAFYYEKRNYSEEIRFLEMDYNKSLLHSKEPFPLKDEIVYIVDFSLSVEEMQEVLKVTKNVYWYDHHKTAVHKYDGVFDFDIPGIRVDGEDSAAMLVWKALYPSMDPPALVKYVSDYDSWTLKYPESKALNYALQAIDTSPDMRISATWEELMCVNGVLLDYIKHGEFILKYIQNTGKFLADTIGYGILLEHPGYFPTRSIFVVHNPCFGFDWFWLVKDNGADVFARVSFDGKKYNVSLYSETVDVSIIAKCYGGGGHAGAAGFFCDELPWDAGNICKEK